MLKEGENPPLDAYDNFVIGPNYVPAPERKKVEGVPEGKVEQFEIDSKETKLFNPGIARDEFGKVDPSNPKTLIVETHPIDYKRKVGVYIPAQYKEGAEAPFMVVHDGPGQANGYKTILDNLIHQKRIPPIVLIAIGNGGGDAQGHERGKEYDNMNGDYAEYIETEVLPRVEKHCGVKLTKDPDGRAAMGNSSGGSAALIMAWFRNDLYHRVLIAIADGYRESEQSWKELLLDCKARGLEIEPSLAIGDGALGFWKAMRQVWDTTKEQRCWVHTIRTQSQNGGPRLSCPFVRLNPRSRPRE